MTDIRTSRFQCHSTSQPQSECQSNSTGSHWVCGSSVFIIDWNRPAHINTRFFLLLFMYADADCSAFAFTYCCCICSKLRYGRRKQQRTKENVYHASTLTCAIISMCVICNISQTLERTERRKQMIEATKCERKKEGSPAHSIWNHLGSYISQFYLDRKNAIVILSTHTHTHTHKPMWIIEAEVDGAAEVCNIRKVFDRHRNVLLFRI